MNSYQKGMKREGEARALLEGSPEWRFLAANVRFRGGEIDLIFEEQLISGDVELVFVEVRAREQGAWASGAESVDELKRMRLETAARRFLLCYQGPASGMRFDILAFDGRSWTHLRSAWFT